MSDEVVTGYINNEGDGYISDEVVMDKSVMKEITEVFF